MPQLWITRGLNPDVPDGLGVLVRFDPAEETPAAIILDHLADYAYDGDYRFYILATDAFIERRLEGSTLTLDLVTYPSKIERAGVDPTLFQQPAVQDASAVRILRAAFEVDPAEYAEAAEETYLWLSAEDASLEQIKEAIADEEDLPLVFAPAPAPLRPDSVSS